MKKEKILISSCLLGEFVKYDGTNNKLSLELLEKLKLKYDLYPVCPEVEGGLAIPRVPCEIVTTKPLKIINKNGIDKTYEFLKGARKAQEICKKYKIKSALLKANSPSCGNKLIYDGSFTSKKIDGKGVTTLILEKEDISVYNESQINQLI